MAEAGAADRIEESDDGAVAGVFVAADVDGGVRVGAVAVG